MKMHWEAVSCSNDAGIWALEKLVEDMSSPGILLFGADYPMKGNVLLILKRLKNVTKDRLIKLGLHESCDHVARHNAVMRLKEMGASSIIGIYIKSSFIDPYDPPEYANWLRLLDLNPPTADGLTFLFTIVDDDCDDEEDK